jgi:DNA (cytosine-5)-methyltransferase 1
MELMPPSSVRAGCYRLIDLFAGCGGMTRGFVDTGRFEPVLAVESDPDAVETYEANFGSHVARTPDGAPAAIEHVENFSAADVVIGGPPCQGFSPLNRDGVGPERRALWPDYLRALDEAEPLAFVMENVPELLRSGEYASFLDAAEERGWRVRGEILNAADYGVPQRRRRAIVVGSRIGGEPPWPARTHHPPDELRPAGAETWRMFADAVAGLPAEPTGRHWRPAPGPRAS